MGITHHFKCPECNLHASCSKGIDRGFRIEVQPMYCTQCKVLANIHIGNYAEYQQKTHYLPKDKICKTCDTGEFLKEWDSPHCPICINVNMLIRSDEICWD